MIFFCFICWCHGQICISPPCRYSLFISPYLFINILITIELTINLQFGVICKIISIFCFHICNILISFSTLKSCDMIFISLIKEFSRVYTCSILCLPTFKLINIWSIFWCFSGKYRLITILASDRCIIDFHYINRLPLFRLWMQKSLKTNCKVLVITRFSSRISILLPINLQLCSRTEIPFISCFCRCCKIQIIII